MTSKASKFELHPESEESVNKTTLRLDSVTESLLLKIMQEEKIPTKVKAVTHFIHRYAAMKTEIAQRIKNENQLQQENRQMYESISGLMRAEDQRATMFLEMEQIRQKHKKTYGTYGS